MRASSSAEFCVSVVDWRVVSAASVTWTMFSAI